jgi:hypothetical protein
VAFGPIVALVFGVWLAIYLDAYHVWDAWVLASIVLWAIAAETGRRTGTYYNGVRDRARELLEQGNDAPSTELAERLRGSQGVVLHLVSIVALLLILLLMIYKPGA